MAIVLLVCACSSSPSPPPETEEAKTRRVAKEAILGLQTHIIVLKSQATFAEYRDVVHTLEQNPQVIAAEGFMFTEVSGSRPHAPATIDMVMKGVDPARVPKVEALPRFLIEGSIGALADSEPRVILGDELAKALGVKVGDMIEVEPNGEDFATIHQRGQLKVVGRFHCGFDEYDRKMAYTSMASLQALVGRGDVATGVEATVEDILHSDKTAEEIEKAIGGPPYQVLDWFELNKAFFKTRE